MLRRLRHSAAFSLLVVGLTVPALAFNPAGRSKKAKPEQKGGKPAGSKPSGAKPAGEKAPPAKPATGEAKADGKADGPNREALIARYLGIVLSQPGSEFPLERLTELYRERDGNLEKLVAELSQRVSKDAAPYSALVALGG